MKLDQSHVAGLELALDALELEGYMTGRGCREHISALINRAKSAPAEVDPERPISIPTALILWAGVDDESQSTQWHQGYEAARGYVKMQIESAIPTVKQSLTVAEVAQGEAVAMEPDLDAVALCGCRIVHSLKNGNILVQCVERGRTAYTSPPSPNAEILDSYARMFEAEAERNDELVELLSQCRGIVASEVERWTRAAAILPVSARVESALLARIDALLAEVGK